MSHCIEFDSAENPRDVIVDVASRLADGELMQTQIEIGTVLIGWSQRPGVIERMFGNLSPGQNLCLCVTGYHQSADYVESISHIGQRLMTRGWPGPLQLNVQFDQPFGLLEALPASVQQRLTAGRRLRLICPKSGFVRDLQKLLSGPLVLTSPPQDDKLITTSSVAGSENGPALFDFCVKTEKPGRVEGLSVVEVTSDHCLLLTCGGITSTDLQYMTASLYLFVCTGNTCRSPMAEGLFRKLLAEKLQCDQTELADRGYQVASAGVAAGPGSPASPEAVQILQSEGIDISQHASQPLSEELIDQADLILTLTRGHREAILMSRPDVAEKIRLLSPEGNDVSDPIGGGRAEYERCKSEIETYLKKLLEEFDVSRS